jgi:uncharacterized protein YkwD
MGSDPWGSVMLPTGNVVDAVTRACRTHHGSGSPTGTGLSMTPQPAHTQNTHTAGGPAAGPTTFPTSHQLPQSTGNNSTSHVPHTSTHVPPPSSQSTVSASPTTSPASPPPQPPPNNPGDVGTYLDAHNSFRAQHGAQPLLWSDQLAGAAQQWANKCVFNHSDGELGPFGENLAAGTGSSYDIRAAIKSWTDESPQYNPNKPISSHFTQVVWKSSASLGCAVATCNGIFPPRFGPEKYFVCEYSPAGNVIGRFPENVQA